MNTLLKDIEARERASSITYDLTRVADWHRRQGASYGRRAPSYPARLVRALLALVARIA